MFISLPLIRFETPIVERAYNSRPPREILLQSLCVPRPLLKDLKIQHRKFTLFKCKFQLNPSFPQTPDFCRKVLMGIHCINGKLPIHSCKLSVLSLQRFVIDHRNSSCEKFPATRTSNTLETLSSLIQ